ncbi:MAG: UDP-N-acetylglucosamine--N-acetylmuramyl-(pentapeptide) pyrophosphoryl-undecaprenol N-acetylglucosamine transferase [Clostridia bacterium]
MNIALTGGGTAGHIMPNIALLPQLKQTFDKILYIGSATGLESKICNQHNINFLSCGSIKFNRAHLLKNFKIPFLLPRYVSEAKKILKTNNIDVVFSKGGYVALPVVLAARSLSIPVVCHESDSSLGVANKITSFFADKTITSFPTSKKKFSYIGNPLRQEIFSSDPIKIKKSLALKQNLPTLLIVGGSLGAQAINDTVYQSLDILCPQYNVIHICGKNFTPIVRPNYHQLDFVDNISDYYAVADYVVARCGASLSGELSALNKQVLYIPLPSLASRGDQIKNAEYLQVKQYALVLSQESLSPATLCQSLQTLKSFKKRKYYYDKNIPSRIVRQIAIVANNSKRLLKASKSKLKNA